MRIWSPPSSIACIAAYKPIASMKSPDMPTSISNESQPLHATRRRSTIHPDRTFTTPTVPSARLHYPQHRPIRKRTALSQRSLFSTAAPPLLFSILIAGLLVELRARLASPLPEAPPGIAVSVQGNTVMQRALIWAESRWPGLWALPVLCVGALGALRAVIWAFAAVLDSFEKRVDLSGAERVRIGRWEDGSSVSGSELLAGMFT
jgi:hypothetical protein